MVSRYCAPERRLSRHGSQPTGGQGEGGGVHADAGDQIADHFPRLRSITNRTQGGYASRALGPRDAAPINDAQQWKLISTTAPPLPCIVSFVKQGYSTQTRGSAVLRLSISSLSAHASASNRSGLPLPSPHQVESSSSSAGNVPTCDTRPCS